MRALVIAAALLLAATAAQAGDAARGKIAFGRECAMCHRVIANTRDSVGPGLDGIAGRKAGSKPGFDYSDAMKNAGFTWSHDKLKAFVTNPDGVVPGSNMMFTGDPTQAEDIAAYLETLK
jgi:cytochrome c